MKNRHMEYDEAISLVNHYKHALIYEVSRMYFGPCENAPMPNEKELVEAYYFNATEEMHLYRDGDGCVSVVNAEEVGDIFVDRQYDTRKYEGGGNRTVVVRDYLTADEDGQMCVVLSRMVEVQ